MYMDAIKKKLTLGVLAFCLAGGGIPALAQQMDPALTATVIAQTAELKNIHKKRKKTQEKIIAAEAAVTVALDRVHSVEDKMLKYLSNAQGAMQNLYQIKRAGELVAKEIPQNCNLLLKSVGSNLKGTAIAAMVSDELADAATQMAALYPFMKQLVTSGSYDVAGADESQRKNYHSSHSRQLPTFYKSRWYATAIQNDRPYASLNHQSCKSHHPSKENDGNYG